MRNLMKHMCVFVLCFVAASLVALATNVAHAQQYPYFDTSDPNVVVDLNVINDGGYGPGVAYPGSSSPFVSGRKLVVPGVKFPVSRLLVPSPGGKIKLKKPGTHKRKKLKRTKKKRRTVRKVIAAKQQNAVAPPPRKAPAKPKISVAVSTPLPPAPAPAKKIAGVIADKKSDKLPGLAKRPPPAAAPVSAPTTSAPPTAAPVPALTAAITEKMPPPMPQSGPQSGPPPSKVKAKAKATEQASLPSIGLQSLPGNIMRVQFDANAAKLPDNVKAELKNLAKKIKQQGNVRLQLLAYAGGASLSSSKARRLSLSRALSVRSFLIEVGVRSTRMDVRALGDKTSEQPINRVDLKIIKR